MPRKPSTARYCVRRGFNLIEAAIVLGVIGLVIGGIWVAAAAVTENQKINRVAEAILYASRQGRALLTLTAIQSISSGGETGAANLAIQAKLFPDDMIVGGALIDPWGNPFLFNLCGGGAFCSSGGERMLIHMTNLTTSRCMGIISKLAPVARTGQDIFFINSNLDGGWSSTYPQMTVSDIRLLCVNGVNVSLHIRPG
jgi:hypothetical protein